MHPLIEASLAQIPRVYGRLVRLRSRPNLDKLVFLSLIGRGDVVFDIGANNGCYTALFSNLVGPRGRVHAFEPVTPTADRLRLEVQRACLFSNVLVREIALAAEPGPVDVFLPGADSGQASLARHSAGSWSTQPVVERHKCLADTLDRYVTSNEINRLDFVKCDVEGAELLVMRGGYEALRRFHPVLHLEVCRNWMTGFGYTVTDLLQLLRTLGYASYWVVGSGIEPLRNAEAQLGTDVGGSSVNLVCFVPGRERTPPSTS